MLGLVMRPPTESKCLESYTQLDSLHSDTTRESRVILYVKLLSCQWSSMYDRPPCSKVILQEILYVNLLSYQCMTDLCIQLVVGWYVDLLNYQKLDWDIMTYRLGSFYIQCPLNALPIIQYQSYFQYLTEIVRVGSVAVNKSAIIAKTSWERYVKLTVKNSESSQIMSETEAYDF